MLNQNQTTIRVIDPYKAAERAVSIMLGGRISKAAAPIDYQLQNSYSNDQRARNAAEIAAELAELTAKRDTESNKATRARARAKARAEARNKAKLSGDSTKAERMEAERIQYQADADKHATNAKRMTATVQSLAAALEATYSDRADLTQAAALEAVAVDHGEANPKYKPHEVATILEATGHAAPLDVLEHTPEGWKLREAKNAARAAADMAKAHAAHRAATNAAGREHRQNAAPTALTSTTTKHRTATPEEIAEWLKTMGGTGPSVQRAAQRKRTRSSDCFETLEWKKPTKGGLPGKWEIITHYRTAPKFESYEAYAEQSGGDTADIVSNHGNNIIESQEAAERLEALINAADLTDRERKYLAYLTDQTAAAHGARARAEYHTEREAARRAAKETAEAASREAWEAEYTAIIDPTEDNTRAAKEARAEAERTARVYKDMSKPSRYKDERQTAERLAFKAMEDSATDRATSLTNADSRQKFRRRIMAQLTKAANPEHLAFMAATVAAPNGEKYPTTPEAWEALIKSSRRGRPTQQSRRPDIIGNQSKAAEAVKLDPVIAWTESGIAPHTMTPEEVEAMTARERAAEAARLNQYGGNIAFIEYRRRLRYEAARTPWKALDATAAAMVFLDHMTPAEQAAVMEARRAERAADSARIRAEAEKATKTHSDTWNSRKGYQITAKAWNSMEAAQRLTMLDRIHAEGMKLEFVTA